MRDNMTFEKQETRGEVTWISDVDEKALWSDFLRLVDRYQRVHKIRRSVNSNRVTVTMP